MENNEIMMNEEIVESNTFEEETHYEESIDKKNVVKGALGAGLVIGLGALAFKKVVKPGAKKAKAKFDGWKEDRKEKKAEKAKEKKETEYIQIDESKVTTK